MIQWMLAIWSLVPLLFLNPGLMVSGLALKYLTHCDLIFVCGITQCSSFILLHVVVQFSQHDLFKSMFFSHCIFFAPLSQTNWSYMHGFLSEVSILIIDLCICFYANTILFWFLWLCNKVWKQGVWCPQLCSFSKLLWISWSFCSLHRFYNCSISVKRPWGFDRDCNESVDCFE